MKRYQIVVMLVIACVPLGLAYYKKSKVAQKPSVLGATWSMTGDPSAGMDLVVKVYALKPDSCFEGDKARIRYDPKSSTISVSPELTKKRGMGNCTPNVPYMAEAVLKKVPAGSYKFQVIGTGRILTADISVPSQGALPPNFTPPAMARGN